MTGRRTLPGYCVLALLLPAPATAQGDTLHFRFDWPVGTSIDVRTTRWQERSGQTDVTDVAATYRIDVEAHPDGRLIRYSNFGLEPGAVTGEAVEEALERIAGLLPSYVVSPRGEFLRIHDLASYRRGIEELISRTVDDREMVSTLRTMLATVLTEEGLTAAVGREWHQLVGQWADADIASGAAYEYSDETFIPLAPEIAIPMIAEFAVTERLSCPGAARRACVRIEHVSTVDEDRATAALRAMFEGIPGAEAAGLSIDLLEIDNLLDIVTEPATLLPRSASISSSVRLRISGSGGTYDSAQLDIRTYEFTYRR